jgi:mRNA-degrading endonuclease RelE of RelBE toxin-antitoxin system
MDRKNTLSHLMIHLETAQMKFFNQKAIMMYLFGRPLLSCKSMTRVSERFKDREPLLIDRTHMDDVTSALIELSHHSFVYRDQYLRQNSKTLHPVNRSNQIEKIISVLDDLRIDYALNISFQNVDISPSENGYHLDLPITVDFLCVIALKTESPMTRSLVLFAIIYDRSQERQHVLDDYLAQSHLQQMGVHLLRLSYSSDYQQLIEEFYDKLLHTDKYLIINPLPIIRSKSKELQEKFSIFDSIYQRNHLLTLKYVLMTEEIEPGEETEEGIVVSQDFLSNLGRKKIIATSRNIKKEDGFLEDFLSTYEPATLDISCYLRFKTLRGYHLLHDKREMADFIVGKTCIKLVKVEKAVLDGKCKEKSIEDGGILVGVGRLYRGKLSNRSRERISEILKPSEWTHFELETNINKKTGKVGRFYRYLIRISHYHIFYQIHQENYHIELV